MFWRLLLSLPVFIGQFFRCVFIGCVIGPMAFFLGQLLPRANFDYDNPPYKPYRWERGGMIYTRIGIQYWKDALPDMSRHIRSMVQKRLVVFRDAEYIDDLIRETCVAELVHWILILLSPIFLLAMPGLPGLLGMAAYMLVNLPFVFIQRYNRPRLVKLYHRQMDINRQRAAVPD